MPELITEANFPNVAHIDGRRICRQKLRCCKCEKPTLAWTDEGPVDPNDVPLKLVQIVTYRPTATCLACRHAEILLMDQWSGVATHKGLAIELRKLKFVNDQATEDQVEQLKKWQADLPPTDEYLFDPGIVRVSRGSIAAGIGPIIVRDAVEKHVRGNFGELGTLPAEIDPIYEFWPEHGPQATRNAIAINSQQGIVRSMFRVKYLNMHSRSEGQIDLRLATFIYQQNDRDYPLLTETLVATSHSHANL
jgi:hypothetical protein